MTPIAPDSPAAAYLEALQHELSDLDVAEREELLEDVRSSLVEHDPEDDATPEQRLGTPAAFAAELRAAAGLRARPAAGPDAGPRSMTMRERWAAARASRPGRALGSAGLTLAPVWWVARVPVLLVAVGQVLDRDFSVRLPIVPRLPSAAATVAWALLLIAVSVGVGLWTRGRARRGTAERGTLLVVNLLLLAAVVPAAVRVADLPAPTAARSADTSSRAPVRATSGVRRDGRTVGNIYPYDSAGRLLRNVRLFDTSGRPLNVGASTPGREVIVGVSGQRLRNVFPILTRRPGAPGAALRPGPLGGRISALPKQPRTPATGAAAQRAGGFEDFCNANPGACPSP